MGAITVPRFMVELYNDSKRDKAAPQEAEAEDWQTAAEKVCGEPLVEGAKLGEMRAKVWAVGKPPVRKKVFRRR
jgi:hypothetical protein